MIFNCWCVSSYNCAALLNTLQSLFGRKVCFLGLNNYARYYTTTVECKSVQMKTAILMYSFAR